MLAVCWSRPLLGWILHAWSNAHEAADLRQKRQQHQEGASSRCAQNTGTLCVVLDHSAHLGLPRCLQNCLQLRQMAADAAWTLAVVTRQLMCRITAATLFFEVPQQHLAATAWVLQAAILLFTSGMWRLCWACMLLRMQSVPELIVHAGCLGWL